MAETRTDTSPHTIPLPKKESELLDSILQRYELRRESLIPVLQDIQDTLHYLPEAFLKEVAKRLSIPLHEVFSVATFYNAFSLKPSGKHIKVCMGTACHVRGASRVLETIERMLNIKAGDTTQDGEFSLTTVNCLGACALGPIVMIGSEYYGNMTPTGVAELIGNLTRKKKQ
jgi:NADH-quinone oxidoreductase subunit E